MQGRDKNERDEWVHNLEEAIHKVSGYYRVPPVSTNEAIKRKVVEADVLLQNMIKEVNFVFILLFWKGCRLLSH